MIYVTMLDPKATYSDYPPFYHPHLDFFKNIGFSPDVQTREYWIRNNERESVKMLGSSAYKQIRKGESRMRTGMKKNTTPELAKN